jgi:glycosyltransferase involved in cell wall biosynthesis
LKDVSTTRILFLVPYPPDEAPSQRFRFEQYLPLLKAPQYEYRIQSFLSLDGWKQLYQSHGTLQKIFSVMSGYGRRLAMLVTVPRYDFVFIHREVTPAGPPLFEWVIAKVFRKKIIYDFDDAIWMTDQVNESAVSRMIRWRSKVGSICRWSYRVSCGNAYLADYARRFNKQVVVNPTTIDTSLHHPSHRHASAEAKITIGWTGSHSTLKYLEEIEPILQQVAQQYPVVQFVVIANKPPALNLPALTFVPWTKKTEIEDLARIDIGIMPLPDDEWSKGKCGFKALQYMALEIPTVASPVGVNTDIIQTGRNGFLCATPAEWLQALGNLLANPHLRQQTGAQGRRTVEEKYSVAANTPVFLGLFL